jgi:hypothetical protein
VESTGLGRPRRCGNGHRQVCMRRSSVPVRQPPERNAVRQVVIPEFNA